MWLSVWFLVGISAAFLAHLYLEVHQEHVATASHEPLELDSKVADTCRMVAAMRALDSARPSIFYNQDPLAQHLAGESHMRVVGEQAERLKTTDLDLNPVSMRTIAIDERMPPEKG
mmetsp:Transcript_25762/g.57029  ORF Transcript_25762/g.57029 Transcript_25762/m.57029 type:complete len:116 (-) Transcript_25762:1420-1767(-)